MKNIIFHHWPWILSTKNIKHPKNKRRRNINLCSWDIMYEIFYVAQFLNEKNYLIFVKKLAKVKLQVFIENFWIIKHKYLTNQHPWHFLIVAWIQLCLTWATQLL